MQGYAVIGAAFGDEGKGLITDYICDRERLDDRSVVNIRHNGGAQAGHGVVSPSGKLHSFHHFGAGTFARAHTHLASEFICNPFLWWAEYAKFPGTVISIDPRCRITTPWDMLLNRMMEEARGHSRHGSVGLGIFETVLRNRVPRFALTFDDLYRYDMVDKLMRIRQEYIPDLISKRGLCISDTYREILSNERLLQDFFHVISLMKQHSVTPHADRYGVAVFEGAQGLALDQNNQAYFPHLTPSSTGIDNVMVLAPSLGVTSLEVIYVTRAYTTRHGAGPLPHEDASLSYRDDNNITGDWQGTPRFSHLDLDLLKENILRDMSKYSQDIEISPCLAVTCLDQINQYQMRFWKDGKLHEAPIEIALWVIENFLELPIKFRSYGPQRNNVSERVACVQNA